jgi:hypothetical protein
MPENKFIVHVYQFGGHEEMKFPTEKEALVFAKSEWKKNDQCYKIKVWDLNKGDIEPNIVDPPALIREFV